MAALISECGKYRHWLTRPSEVKHPRTGAHLFCMLNPSTANHEENDKTVNRLRAFCRSWEAPGFAIVNCYDFIATDPKDLDKELKNVSDVADHYILTMAKEYGGVVCAWGAVPTNRRVRINRVIGLLQAAGVKLWCFGLTKNGDPKHPLYLKGDTKLIEYSPKVYTI